jgi:hypothetical protein
MTEYQERRTRTVTWNDPAPALRAAQTMSGIAYLKAILYLDIVVGRRIRLLT